MDGIQDRIIKRLTKVLSKNPELIAAMMIQDDGDLSVFVTEFRKEMINQLAEESGRKKSE